MKNKSLLLHTALLFVFIFASAYFVLRVVFLRHGQYAPFERLLAYMLLFAELFIIFHGAGFLYNIYRIAKISGREAPGAPEPETYPLVAVLVPARHEPAEVLENTFNCMYNLDYPAKRLYLLDDSSEEKYKAEAQRIAAKYGAIVFSREIRHGAKAGIINDCVKTLDEKYVAIFDADQNPMPDFLKRLVPLLEARSSLAFVQTPQYYTNIENNRVAYAASMQQAVFYEYVCEGKSSGEAMICCGTNVILRKEALLDVGGFDETTVTEDFATSVLFHIKGWKTQYINRVKTFGMGPENLGAYFKQQSRWAAGNVATLKKVVMSFIKSPMALKPGQWMDYWITGTYYLIGWAYLVLFLCPVLLVFFNIPSFFMHPAVYSLTFIPYFLLSYYMFYASMMKRNYPFKGIFKGSLLLFCTIPVYLKAVFSGLIGKRGSFVVTAKSGEKTIPYRDLIPQIALWAVNLSALIWGFNRLFYELSPALIVNLWWIFMHMAFISGIFYFNEQS
jgi:cellulose synthase (UDP-forming)